MEHGDDKVAVSEGSQAFLSRGKRTQASRRKQKLIAEKGNKEEYANLDGRKQHGTRKSLVGYQLAVSPKASRSFQFNGTQSYILGIGGASQP